MSVALVTSAVAAACMARTAAGRSVHDFDAGWKFHLGDAAAQELCPDDAFKPFIGMYCPQWAHQAAYSITLDECRRYCCGDSSCAGWNYDLEGGWCSVGNSDTGCAPGTSGGENRGSGNWTGGIRTVPAALIEPAAGGPHDTSFDDSSWRDITVPHDFIVETAPFNQTEWNHGFRPKNVSWYRKKFTLEESFSSKTVWLEFEGVFRSSDFWLNGKHLGHHSSGYTGVRFELDSDSGVKFGQPNLLAVRIDPRANEGWWYEVSGGSCARCRC
jgi:hypothetical protein